MFEFDRHKTLLASLSAQLTPELLAEARGKGKIDYLPPGILTELTKGQPFTVEDIVTLVLAGWISQKEEIQDKEARISTLEYLCNHQQNSIDSIVNQTVLLRNLLGPVLPKKDRVSPVDILKEIATCAGSDGTAKTQSESARQTPHTTARQKYEKRQEHKPDAS